MQVGKIQKIIMIWHYMYGIYKTSFNDKFQFVGEFEIKDFYI